MSTEPKKKIVKKKIVTEDINVVSKPKAKGSKSNASKEGMDSYISNEINGIEDIKKAIDVSSRTMFDIDVAPKSWVLPNRVKFTKNWLDRTFKYAAHNKKPKCTECAQEETCPAVKVDSVSLFPHQKFIKDYIQFDSPYRGILLYHGLGVGKSCCSIAAAELLMNNMDVTVLLPASLRGNYINEIKKCGRRFYHLKQRWVFVPLPVFSSHLKEVSNLMKVDTALIIKQGGVWIPHNSAGNKPNFVSMQSNVQNQIVEQINNIITNRFHFINYNGLKSIRTKKSDETDDDKVSGAYISDMIKNGNPFDNKCVVVDEIHNLISRIVNGGKIGTALYKLLMTAKGCKLILLSGTPIINYPYEVSYLINLLVGPQLKYNVQVGETDDFDTLIKNLLDTVPQVDSIKIEEKGKGDKILKISLLPKGFKYEDRTSLEVKRYTSSTSAKADDVIMQDVLNVLKKSGVKVLGNKYQTKEFRILPESEKEFNKYFVDMEKGRIINPRLFARHVLGTVSYYSTYSKELYPEWTVEDTLLPMTKQQFPAYESARSEERKKEGKSKTNKGDDGGNIFKDSGHVYRFYSRAICNFTFPEAIKRPYPTMSMLKTEIDDDEDAMKNYEKVSKDIETSDGDKKKKQKEYDSLLQQALEKLASSPNNYLGLENLGKYSPKFKSVIERVNEINGPSLVYSQFRRVEGLGILSLALKANGYAEFKIKRGKDGEWDVDMSEEDMKKPKYIVFTGSNEETQVLLKVYNSDRENIPTKIRAKLQQLSYDGRSDNHRGSIIKVLMITQSGAEGISLKNVRSVHVLEPYWNYIRIDQVIGRAIRTCSHVDLPQEDRNVKVYIYNVIFTPEQLEASFTIRVQDNSLTTDEHIYKLAKKKAQIINLLLDNIKKASVDCALNAKAHSSTNQVKCFAFPVNLKDDEFSYQLDFNEETFDNQYDKDVEVAEWKGQLLVTKKGTFVIRPDTNEVYDYDLYVESGKLVRIGFLRIVGDKKQVMKK